MNRRHRLLSLGMLFFGAVVFFRVGANLHAQTPAEAGRMVAEELLGRNRLSWVSTQRHPDHPHLQVYVNPRIGYTSMHYAEACVGFGALRYAKQAGDQAMVQRLIDRYRIVLEKGPENTGGHVDANVYGILPLEIYLQTGDEAWLREGLRVADMQWEDPREDGLTTDTRFWIDDMWMVGALQTQAWRATSEMKYLDRAAIQLELYADRLQRPNGLFHHGENAPFFWGRGNGWVAASLAFLLSELPEDHPRYPAIVDSYRRMMDALRRYQAPSGMWRQLVDNPATWDESSCTAMFGYAMTVGVRKGILTDPAYPQAVDIAWNALMTHLEPSGRINEVCVGTNKSDDIQHYFDRPRRTGDFHGQAPTMWFAAERMAAAAD